MAGFLMAEVLLAIPEALVSELGVWEPDVAWMAETGSNLGSLGAARALKIRGKVMNSFECQSHENVAERAEPSNLG